VIVNQNVFLYVKVGEASPKERKKFIMASAGATVVMVVGVTL
jgi:hypothetical protein